MRLCVCVFVCFFLSKYLPQPPQKVVAFLVFHLCVCVCVGVCACLFVYLCECGYFFFYFVYVRVCVYFEYIRTNS